MDGRRPFLKKEDLIDPWGEPYGCEVGGPEDSCIVWSSGPDRKLGTADDIVRGYSKMVERWKVRHGLPADGQGTYVVQGAASSAQAGGAAASPPGRKEAPKNVATRNGPPQNEPAKTKSTPWKLSLLIGVVILGGGAVAWRYFRKGR
jgi:hypothetical protein